MVHFWGALGVPEVPWDELLCLQADHEMREWIRGGVRD